MPRDLRAAALHYLRSGAVTIAPLYVEALVEGYTSTHRIRLATGEWSCSCRYEGCAHLAAVQLITGAGTGARPLTTTALRRAL